MAVLRQGAVCDAVCLKLKEQHENRMCVGCCSQAGTFEIERAVR